MSEKIIVAGVMSGTSLDGLDIALCSFENYAGRWTFEVLAAVTIPYSDEWSEKLSNGFNVKGAELAELHAKFGNFIGNTVKDLIEQTGIIPQLISSHGHTIFHQPSKSYTFQIGCGAAISAITHIDTVCDFRTSDVAHGGQGAPLVPVGDRLLFGGHKFCLNLGGIANISFEKNDERIAFDICPANLPLNYLASLHGKKYDENGDIASSGIVLHDLLEQLNQLTFYKTIPPKSLGREWFESEFMPLIHNEKYNVADRMKTVVEHIGIQISNALHLSPGTTMFTTGGGAFNNLLVEVIEEQVSRHGIHVVVPDKEIIQFKEALIFAFLGLLRLRKEPNAFAAVTGAKMNSVGGCIYAG